MYISRVCLVNYRNFANARFIFNKGVNTIIGENGSGKTNVFRAIRLLLEDASIPYAYKLNEGDFNRKLGSGKWRGHWIVISIEFDEISSEEAIQSLFIHRAGVIEEEFVEKAAYNLFFRPKLDVRQKLAELMPGDVAGMNKLLDSLTIEDNYETFFTGKSTADFNDPTVYKELVGDFENVVFPGSIDASKFGSKIPHQLSVSKDVSFTFIQALRDVVSDFHNNRTNPLLTLLKHKGGEINPETYDPISKLVVQLNDSIERLEDVQGIRRDIKSTIQDAVGLTYSPSSLSIKSSVPDEAEKLLQSLKLFIGEPGEDHEGGINELSLGGANLIFLTLKLLEFKYRRTKETFANFLIIEEPEAHIHNHIQKTLFDKLDYEDTQIIYSTHSTQISEVSNVENINILARKHNYAEVFQPATGLSPESINEIQRYLDAVRTNLLFAKGVILVEGDAEEILIPIMIKSAFGVSLDELGISLINIRSTGFQNVAQLFHDERIQRRCSILTDLDNAICDTTIYEGDSARVISYKNKVERSKDSGLLRKAELDKFVKGNKWIRAFYADYTFEVDFVHNGNDPEVRKIINQVYTDKDTRAIAASDLLSDDLAKYGKRVLTMAKQEGKGWFAILLGKHIDCWTIVPEYIMDAIIFARQSYSLDIIADIVQYRIVKIYDSDNELDFKLAKTILAGYRNGSSTLLELIAAVENVIPDDQILTLLEKFR